MLCGTLPGTTSSGLSLRASAWFPGTRLGSARVAKCAVAFRLEASRDATAQSDVLICTTRDISVSCAVDLALHFRRVQTCTTCILISRRGRSMLTAISTHFHQGGPGMWPILFT